MPDDTPRHDPLVQGGQRNNVSLLEKLSWVAQLFQVMIGIPALVITILGILLVVWQLRESNIIAWRTYLDERGASLGDRTLEKATAACLFGYELSPSEIGQLHEDCKNIIFSSSENARSHLLYAEQRLDYLREVNYFDHTAIPVGLPGKLLKVLDWFGYDGLTSELGSWQARVRRGFTDDPWGSISFILVRWRCWREDGNLDEQISCAEEEARAFGLCKPHDRCTDESDILNCTIRLRCDAAGNNSQCFEEEAHKLGVCTGTDDDCLCSARLREKSNAFTEMLRRPFPRPQTQNPS